MIIRELQFLCQQRNSLALADTMCEFCSINVNINNKYNSFPTFTDHSL